MPTTRTAPGRSGTSGSASPPRSASSRSAARRRTAAVTLAAAVVAACLSGPARAEPPAFPADRAWAHLRAQCDLGPRHPGSPGHRDCLEYIAGALARAGGRVRRQAFRDSVPGLGRAHDFTNLIARFGPERPRGLLLAAHWDTRPWADRDPDSTRRDEPILGANDGASGVAVLLALAEAWRERPPPIPITLAFLDGEDNGREGRSEEYLLGSRRLADELPSLRPEAGLVLDMVGSATVSLTLEAQSRELFPDWAARVDGLASDLGLTAYRSDWGPSMIDDHLPLIEAGLPTLLLVDFRDPFWHTHGDRPENCSVTGLDEAGRLVLALVHGGTFR